MHHKGGGRIVWSQRPSEDQVISTKIARQRSRSNPCQNHITQIRYSKKASLQQSVQLEHNMSKELGYFAASVPDEDTIVSFPLPLGKPSAHLCDQMASELVLWPPELAKILLYSEDDDVSFSQSLNDDVEPNTVEKSLEELQNSSQEQATKKKSQYRQRRYESEHFPLDIQGEKIFGDILRRVHTDSSFQVFQQSNTLLYSERYFKIQFFRHMLKLNGMKNTDLANSIKTVELLLTFKRYVIAFVDFDTGPAKIEYWISALRNFQEHWQSKIQIWGIVTAMNEEAKAIGLLNSVDMLIPITPDQSTISQIARVSKLARNTSEINIV